MSKWAIAVSMAYGVIQTNYFGWHLLPKSDAEVFADGLGLLLAMLAMLVFVIEEKP